MRAETGNAHNAIGAICVSWNDRSLADFKRIVGFFRYLIIISPVVIPRLIIYTGFVVGPDKNLESIEI